MDIEPVLAPLAESISCAPILRPRLEVRLII